MCYGRLDALVNNAAIHYDTWQRASAADLQVVREALEVNLLGAWQTSLTLLPLLRASRHGRIVNVSSEAGSCSWSGRGRQDLMPGVLLFGCGHSQRNSAAEASHR